MNSRILIAALLTCGTVLAQPAVAARGEKVDGCVELGAGYKLQRSGPQHLYVQDGDQHYRLSFHGGSCDAMTLTSKVEFVNDGGSDRICAAETQVKAHRQKCRVAGIVRIDEDEYARQARRNR